VRAAWARKRQRHPTGQSGTAEHMHSLDRGRGSPLSAPGTVNTLQSGQGQRHWASQGNDQEQNMQWSDQGQKHPVSISGMLSQRTHKED
jgi:hypothetical protein